MDERPFALLTPQRVAFLAASTVFGSGFLAMNLLWFLGDWNPSLPGLYAFASATVGDGVCLPILAYGLVRASCLQRGLPALDRRLIIGAGVLGGLIGLGTQIQWLVADSPRPNWTFPTPHSFNVAGWYHAVFLVLCSAFMGAIAAAALLRLRQSSDPHTGTEPLNGLQAFGLLGIVIPALAFAALLGMDNRSTGSSSITVPVILSVVLALMIAIILAWSTRGRQVLFMVPAVLLALPVANGIGFIVAFQWTLIAGLAWVVAALAASLPSAFLFGRTPFERLMVAASTALVGAIPVTILWDGLAVSGTAVASICLVGVLSTLGCLALLKWWQGDDAQWWKLALGSVGSLPMVAMAATGYLSAKSGGAGNLVALCVGAVSGWLVFTVTAWTVREQFEHVIKSEETDDYSEVDRLRSMWRAYPCGLAAFSSALLALILFLFGTSGVRDWDSAGSSDFAGLVEPGVVLAVLILALAICRFFSSRGSTWLLAVSGGCAAVWSVEMLRQLGDWPGDPWLLVIAALTAIIAGLFVGESFRSNLGYLHITCCRLSDGAVSLLYAIATALTVWWICVPAVGSRLQVQQFGYSVAAMLIGAAAFILLPWLAAFSLPGARRYPLYRLQKPVGGVLQDCFLMFVLVLTVGWLPSLLQVHLPNAEDWIGAILFYLSLVGASYVYVMNNNLGHVRRETARIERKGNGVIDPLNKQALDGLARHVIIQNRLALVVILPIGVFAVVSEFDGFQSGSLLDLVRKA